MKRRGALKIEKQKCVRFVEVKNLAIKVLTASLQWYCVPCFIANAFRLYIMKNPFFNIARAERGRL